MRRAMRRLLTLSLLLGLPGCSGPAPRPSVLLITIDTLRADHLGCYGYPRPTSPRIDRLAAEGIVFDRAFTSLPRTTQSIASIMTGRYPKGHGARGLFSALPAANLTLAEILKEQGYATGAVVSNLFLRPGKGFEQGFDRYHNPPSRWDGDSAAEVTAAALTWLEEVPAGRPFFLWVHYLDPHWTYEPSAPYDRAFDPGFDQPFTLFEDLRSGRLTKGQIIFGTVLGRREIEHVVSLYDGGIAHTDAFVGLLLDHVARRAGGSPLLRVLTADHGESLGEHGYHFAHGEYLYQPELRVPLLVSLPGRIAAGARAAALVQNVDIAPTILALLGIERLQGGDGRPILQGAGGHGAAAPYPGREVAFAESDFQLIHAENRRYHIPGPDGRWSAAFDARHKLIQIPRPRGPLLEFYDLEEDPGETRNLEGTGRHAEARARLMRELLRFADYEAGPGGEGPAPLDEEDRERLKSLGYIN
jgi:arylsulfatase